MFCVHDGRIGISGRIPMLCSFRDVVGGFGAPRTMYSDPLKTGHLCLSLVDGRGNAVGHGRRAAAIGCGLRRAGAKGLHLPLGVIVDEAGVARKVLRRAGRAGKVGVVVLTRRHDDGCFGGKIGGLKMSKGLEIREERKAFSVNARGDVCVCACMIFFYVLRA
jgi:hypothetical protein